MWGWQPPHRAQPWTAGAQEALGHCSQTYFGVVLCWDRSWTWWSSWVPSIMVYSLILWRQTDWQSPDLAGCYILQIVHHFPVRDNINRKDKIHWDALSVSTKTLRSTKNIPTKVQREAQMSVNLMMKKKVDCSRPFLQNAIE